MRRLPLIGIVVVLVLALASIMIPRANTAPQRVALLGTTLPQNPAPGFSLRDQFGARVSLRQFRGHPVVLTFMDSNCTALCPVVAETVHRSLSEMGSAGRNVAVLAISTNPEHDTSATIRRFSNQHHLLNRWHFLTSPRGELQPIWDAYHLYVAPASSSPLVDQHHTSATYLLDKRGRERVLMTADPATSDLITDLRILLGLRPQATTAFGVPAPEAGHPAPLFAARTLDGRSVSLRSLRGKVVLLNFWATWCTACKSEVPMLSRWYRQTRGRNLMVLGVNEQEDRGTVAAYLRKYAMPYPVALDESSVLGARYDVAALPKSLIVDGQGVVQMVKLGELSEHDFAAHVAPLLNR